MKTIKYSLLIISISVLLVVGGIEILAYSYNQGEFLTVNNSEILLASDDSSSDSDTTSGSSDLYSGIDYRSPIKHSVLTELLSYLLQLLFWLGITGMTLIVLYGAFQMIFSGGDPAKFSKGQKTIMYATLGLVLILLSRAIVAIIKSVLTPN